MEALFRGSSSILFNFEIIYIEVPDNELKIVNGIEVFYTPVVHSFESNPHGLKVRVNEKTLTYSGDTEWTENLIPLAGGSDLFIVECYNFKGKLKYHMSYDLLVLNKKKLATNRIILTHLGNDMIDHLSELEIEVCEDEDCITI